MASTGNGAPGQMREDVAMAATQTPDEIQTILARLEGEEISALQVLGINSLKSHSPMPEALQGDKIESTAVFDRHVTLITTAHEVAFDLQRTGKLVWLPEAKPHAVTARSARPTVRLILASSHGVDLIEPAQTKRITVTLAVRA